MERERGEVMGSWDLENGGRAKSRGNNYQPTLYSPSYFVDSNERQWTYWLVPMIVIANIFMLIITMFINNCPKNKTAEFEGKCLASFLGRFSFQPVKENLLLGPSSSTLDKLGALEWNKVVNEHQWWRLISCIWLHAGVWHLAANMLFLVFIGIRLEKQFGFIRVGLIYILSGFGGSIMSLLFIQKSISVGASGALFGLLGAILSELFTNWTMYAHKGCALITLLLIILLNLALGLLLHVDNFAHIGGFLSGFLLGFILLRRPQFGWKENQHLPVGARPISKHTVFQRASLLISLVLLIAGFAVGIVMLSRGVNGNDGCKWCHYLSCVPISKWKCNG